MAEVPRDGLVTERTMTREELHALQGENGEIYRGGYIPNENEYRKETTGTSDKEMSQIMTELSQFNYKNTNVISNQIKKIIHSKETVIKLLEYRGRKTMDMFYGTGDYNNDRLFTDISIISELQQQGYDLSDVKLDIDYLANGTSTVGIENLIDKMKKGIAEKQEYGYDTMINNPYNNRERVNAIEILDVINSNYQGKLLSDFKKAKMEQALEDSMLRNEQMEYISEFQGKRM